MAGTKKGLAHGSDVGSAARAPLMRALEPRILLDAAAVASGAELAADGSADLPAAETRAESVDDRLAPAIGDYRPPAEGRRELIFVDAAVDDYQSLLGGVAPGTEVVVLERGRDGLAQMMDYLHGRDGFDAIHLLSHGGEGSLSIGSTTLDLAGVEANRELLGRIGGALNAGGDLLLYGCRVAADGDVFIDALAEVTGADVAASTDATGSARLGGDWVLEAATGEVEAGPFANAATLDGYDGLLAVDLTSNSTADWTAVTPANGQHDYLTDQQTSSGQSVRQDVVGDATYRSAYVHYDNNGTSGNSADDVLSFRIRVNNSNDGRGDTSQFGSFAWVGVDADLNGTVDFFVGAYSLGSNSQVIGIYDADGAGNTGPNDTGIAGSPAFSYDRNTAGFSNMWSYLQVGDGSNFSSDADYFLSFQVKISDLNGVRSSFGLSQDITESSTLRYIIGTAAQDNSFNQDVSGYNGFPGNGDTITWEQMGVFTPTLNMDGSSSDTTAPTVTSIVRQNPTAEHTNADSVTFQVTFSEDVANVDTTDFELSGTAAGDGTVNSVTRVSSGVYNVTVTGVTDSNGTLNLDIKSGQNIQDASGNALTNRTPTSGTDETYTLDNTAPTVPTVVSQTTSDTTPTITGTATVGSGETLTVVVNGATYNNVTVSNGSWSIDTGAAAVSSGTLGTFVAGNSYSVTATVTDSAGNSAVDTSSSEVTITAGDTTAPMVTSIVRQSPTAEHTNADSVTFRVTFSEDVSNVGTADFALSGTAAGDGTIASVSQVSASVYDVTVTGLTDSNGTVNLDLASGTDIADGASNTLTALTPTGADETYTLDNTAPAAPTVVSQTTSDTTPTITGTATVGAGETLTVVVNGATYNNVTVSNGSWSIDTGAAAVSSGTLGTFVAGNSYSVTATVTDSAGNSAVDTTSSEVTITAGDTTAPTVTSSVRQDPTAEHTNADSVIFRVTFSEDVSNVGTADFTLSGTAAGDGTIGSVSQVSASVYDVTVTGLTSSNGTVNLDLANGTDIADGASNTLTALTPTGADETYTLDNTAPAAPTVVSQTTRDTTPTLTGTATVGSGETLTVTVNGVTYTVGDGNLSLNGTNWTLTIPGGNELSENSYDVTAKVTDTAGNATSDATSGELVIDTTAPVVPTVNTLSTSDTTPTITGTATVGSGETLTVVVNGATYENVTVSGGSWSIDTGTATVTSGTLGAFVAGNRYSVTATVTDTAGNGAVDTSSNEVTITAPPPPPDTSAPAVPTVDALSTRDNQPTLTGSFDADDAAGGFTVTVDGVTYTLGVDAALSASGDRWSLDLSVAGHTLAADRSYNVTAVAVDGAGNRAVDATAAEVTILPSDTTAPTLLSSVRQDPTGELTDAGQVTFRVTFSEAVERVDVADFALSGSAAADGTVSSVSRVSDGVYDVTVSGLGGSDGSLNLDLAAGSDIADGAGNGLATLTPSGADESYLLDHTAPARPTVDRTAATSGTPTLTGGAVVGEGERLSVTVDGVTYTEGDGRLSREGDRWSLVIPPENALADGRYEVTATITDRFGRESRDVTVDELIVDTTPPIDANGNVSEDQDDRDGGESTVAVDPEVPPADVRPPVDDGPAPAADGNPITAPADEPVNAPATRPAADPYIEPAADPANAPTGDAPADPVTDAQPEYIDEPVAEPPADRPAPAGRPPANPVAPVTLAPAADDGGSDNTPAPGGRVTTGGDEPPGGGGSVSATQRDGNAEMGNEVLMVDAGINDQSFDADGGFEFQIPDNAFSYRGESGEAELAFEAARSDGSPLPEWLSFDTNTATFSGTPPEGVEGVVEIRVVARDADGNEAVAEFRLRLEREEEGSEEAAAPVDSDDGGESREADAGAGGDERAAAPDGKPSLAAQLRGHGRFAMEARQQALLRGLADIVRGNAA